MASKNIYLSKLSSDSATAKERLGKMRKEWNSTDGCFKVYKYAQASLIGSSVGNGRVLYFYDTIGTVATDDVSTTFPNLPAGIAIGTLTDSNYGWIQVGGYHSAVQTNADNDISDGDSIIGTYTDGKCDSVAAGTACSVKCIGVAVAADVDASDTVAVQLNVSYGDIIQ